MNDIFDKVKEEHIKIIDLEVHPHVQRSLRPRKVINLVENFEPNKFGVLSVVPATKVGKYWIFDGQHRFEAAKAWLKNSKDWDQQKLPCRVHHDLTEQELAQIFLGQNDTLAVYPLDKWPIRLMAKEETALKIDKLLKGKGLHIGKSASVGTIKAVTTVDSIYRKYGEETLNQTLTVLSEAWNKNPTGFDQLLLTAVSTLCYKFNGDLDRTELTHKLAKSGHPSTIIGEGRFYAKQSSLGPGRALTVKILNIYNKKKKNQLEL